MTMTIGMMKMNIMNGMEPKTNYTRAEVQELILELRNIAMYSNSHKQSRHELQEEISGFELRNS